MIALVTAVPFLGILFFCFLCCLPITPLVRHTKGVEKATLEVQMVCNEAFYDVVSRPIL
jgi:hypothetical protein